LADNFLSREMSKAMLKIYILRRVKRSKVNSYSLLKEIAANKNSERFFEDKKHIKNEVYNTLNSLEKSNYIKATQKAENGRLKNYYTLTKRGTELLGSARLIFRKNLDELTKIFHE
jgi:DNA-binding PadR family transcriptional regulator